MEQNVVNQKDSSPKADGDRDENDSAEVLLY